MANEINVSISFTCSKGGAAIAAATEQKTSDMTGEDMFSQTQSIPTSGYTALDVGSIGFPAIIMVKNMDSSNNVSIFKDNAGAHLMSRLRPGETCLLRGVGAAPFLQASVAAVLIFAKGCEE